MPPFLVRNEISKVVWAPTEREIASALTLDAADRYAHFIKRVADCEVVWCLWRDGWVLAGDSSHRQLVPVWPHEHYAAVCAQGGWAGYAPRAIELDAWMARWLPGIAGDGRSIAVFPTPEDVGIEVLPDRLLCDLNNELANY